MIELVTTFLYRIWYIVKKQPFIWHNDHLDSRTVEWIRTHNIRILLTLKNHLMVFFRYFWYLLVFFSKLWIEQICERNRLIYSVDLQRQERLILFEQRFVYFETKTRSNTFQGDHFYGEWWKIEKYRNSFRIPYWEIFNSKAYS